LCTAESEQDAHAQVHEETMQDCICIMGLMTLA